MAINATFIVSPMPNSTMSSGESAGNGTALSMCMGLSMIAWPMVLDPAMMPAGTAVTTPRATPRDTL